jgi:hypothetical protein
MPALDNGTKLPVVLEMTCFTGSFQNPAFDTLDESLLRKQNGGAVAVWGAAGLGVSTGHSILADGFMRSVYHDGRATLGAATLAGKLELFATGQNLDLIDTFVLLGDPAMRLNLRTHIAYLPSIRH